MFQNALRESNASRAAICLEILALNTPRNKLEPLAAQIIERYEFISSKKIIFIFYN